MKISSIIKSIFQITLIVLITSCAEYARRSEAELTQPVSIDSLDQLWSSTWNSRNIEAISNLFTDDAMLIAGGWRLSGKDSLVDYWIKDSAPVMANLKLEPYTQGVSATMAFSAGGYTHDVVLNDSLLSSNRGIYTCIWEAQPDKSWKVTVIQIEDTSEKAE